MQCMWICSRLGPGLYLQSAFTSEGLTLKVKVKVKSLSRVQLFAIPWTNEAHQAPPSMGFSRQEYWSGLPFHSPGDLPDPGIEPKSPELQADVLTSEQQGSLGLTLSQSVSQSVQSLSCV